MSVGSEVRKLAAVMFTDIAGYTAMVQQDEAYALRQVAIHRRHLEENTKKYQGQVIQFYGDGSLSIYDSVVDAVRCAIAMQQAYAGEGKVPVRIGIHLGDFVIKDGTVFGDGVNIASRIQAEGVPGGILLSEKVNRELINHSDIQTVSLGTYALKNVTEPVRIFAVSAPGLVIPRKKNKLVTHTRHSTRYVIPLVAIGLTLFIVQLLKKTQSTKELLLEERIAVPEFKDFTGNQKYNTVSKMAAHWITTDLIESVHASVVSYQSAVENDQIALASANPHRFSSQTGAVNVIDGSYRLVGKDSLEFSANIINLKSGAYLEALSRVRCPGDDPMRCIQELSSQIKGFWKSRPDNVLTPPKYEAYKAYLEARVVWLEDKVQAEQLLRKSIEIDSQFIDAYFLLLDWFYNQRQFAEASQMLEEIHTRFKNLTPRQQNYLLYHEADNKGHNVEAFTYFLNEYQLDPKDLFVNTSAMVMAADYLNDPRKVLEFYEQINPDSLALQQCSYCQTRFSLAIYAYHALGKTKEARKLADKLRVHAHDPIRYQRLIEFYVSTNDTTVANQILAKAVTEVAPPFKPYLFLVAGRQAQLKDDRTLKDYYARLSASNAPDSSRALARSYYLMDSLDRALDIYALALTKNSTDKRIFAEMGVIYARKGDKTQAEKMITILDGMKRPYDYGNTPYFQGRIAANLGEREKALELLRQSLEEGNKFFGSEFYTQDPDLMMLRNDPDYKKLLKRL